MAKEDRYKNLNMWEKGQSGNPNGRPPRTEEQKRLIEMFGPELTKIIKEIASLSVEELKKEAAREDIPVLKAGMCKTLARYRTTGDYNKWLEPLVTRAIGKPKEQSSSSGTSVSLNYKKKD